MCVPKQVFVATNKEMRLQVLFGAYYSLEASPEGTIIPTSIAIET
jgi:hypothetical protein